MPESKIIDILDPQAGTIKETVVPAAASVATAEEEDYKLRGAAVRENGSLKGLGLGQYRSLREAATTADFPTLLRTGLKQILFASYDDTPSTYQEWIASEPSDKQAEDWLEMNRIGTLPIVGESNPYPELSVDMDRTVRIANYKYGDRIVAAP